MVARGVGMALAAASTVVVARLLDPAGFGAFAAAMSVSTTLGVFGAMGVEQLYLRGDIDRTELNGRVVQVAGVTCVVSLFASILWPGLSSSARVALTIVAVASAGDTLKVPWLVQPQLELRFRGRAWRELICRFSAFVAVCLGAVVTRSAVGAAVGACVGSLLPLFLIRFRTGRWWRDVGHEARVTYRRGVAFALSGALYTVYFQIDLVLLASFGLTIELADYRAAYSFIVAIIALPVVLNNDMLRPLLYRGERYRHYVTSFGAMSVMAGFIVAGLVWLLAPRGVTVVFGASYGTAVPLLRILALALPMHFVSSWLGNVLLGGRWIRPVVIIQGAGAALNIVANLVVIPRHGAAGAAWVTVITEAVTLLCYLVVGTRTRLRPKIVAARGAASAVSDTVPGALAGVSATPSGNAEAAWQ
jgi:O-antigen/teichoic acid export membrane protein